MMVRPVLHQALLNHALSDFYSLINSHFFKACKSVSAFRPVGSESRCFRSATAICSYVTVQNKLILGLTKWDYYLYSHSGCWFVYWFRVDLPADKATRNTFVRVTSLSGPRPTLRAMPMWDMSSFSRSFPSTVHANGSGLELSSTKRISEYW
jgi:hypothetical protein